MRGGGKARVGISIGTATYGADGETLDQLLVAADQAMYRAKSRNKLEILAKNQRISNLDTFEPESVFEIENNSLVTVN